MYLKASSTRLKSPRTLRQQLTKSSATVSRSLDFSPTTLEKRNDPHHIPYYLSNFECILRGVFDETDDDKELFNDTELKVVETFRNLSLDEKKLYVRLFQRKHHWILSKSISYEEIQNVHQALERLCLSGFVQSGAGLTDLESMLELLSAPGVKQLCKSMNISRPWTSSKPMLFFMIFYDFV